MWITSHPAASSHLCDIADCIAKVLGFTEKDQKDFIQSTSALQQHNVGKIKEHLQTNPFLNKLCNGPLNTSILLCLAESGMNALPTTQTSFYGNFVVMSVTCILKENDLNATSTFNLNDLLNSYNLMVKELPQFAFHALQRNQAAFTEVS